MTTTLNIDLLRKVWNMAEHGTPGEQAAARNRAESIVRLHGKTLADVPGILATHSPQAARTPHFSRWWAQQQARQAEADRRFDEIMRQARARMTPEQRAASEACEAWMNSGAMHALMKWQSLSAAQQKMLLVMADPHTTARWRAKSSILDLFDKSGRLIAVKIGLMTSMTSLVAHHVVRQELITTFRITPSGQEVLRFRDSKPPKGPYDR